MQDLSPRHGMEELVAFIAVADAGSFVAASKAVGRDPSVLSRRISSLEKRLGIRLISRTTRKIALTEVGLSYRERVKSILAELERANVEASESAASPRGLLKVSLPMVFGRVWIAPLLPAFLAEYPDITLDVRFTDRYVDIVAERYDVTIRVGRMLDSSLTSRRIAGFKNILVASPGYLAQHGTPEKPADIANHCCLGFTGLSSWPDWPLERDGKKEPVKPVGALVTDNSELCLFSAIAGIGISLIPDWLAGPAISQERLVEVLHGWSVKDHDGVFAVMPPGNLVPAKTRLFVNQISKAIRAGWRS
nr:LysR family transcriptional regulator [Aminobacter sp. MSH1]